MSLKTKEKEGCVGRQECYQLKHRTNPIFPLRQREIQMNLFDSQNEISCIKIPEGNMTLIHSRNFGPRNENKSSRERTCPRPLHLRTHHESPENTILIDKRKVTFADPVAISILDPEVTLDFIGDNGGQGGRAFDTFPNQSPRNSSVDDVSGFAILTGDEGSTGQLSCRVVPDPDEDRILRVPETRLLRYLAIRRRCLMVCAFVSVVVIAAVAGIGTIAYLARHNNNVPNPSLSPQTTKTPSLINDAFSISDFSVSDCGSWYASLVQPRKCDIVELLVTAGSISCKNYLCPEYCSSCVKCLEYIGCVGISVSSMHDKSTKSPTSSTKSPTMA
jgi:hypothetical protein